MKSFNFLMTAILFLLPLLAKADEPSCSGVYKIHYLNCEALVSEFDAFVHDAKANLKNPCPDATIQVVSDRYAADLNACKGQNHGVLYGVFEQGSCITDASLTASDNLGKACPRKSGVPHTAVSTSDSYSTTTAVETNH